MCGGVGRLTDAGRHVGACLLVAAGTAVAGQSGNALLAGTLAAQVVARLAGRADGVAVTSCG